jgi:hypothetical protein
MDCMASIFTSLETSYKAAFLLDLITILKGMITLALMMKSGMLEI